MSVRIVELPLDGPLFKGAIRVYGDAFLEPPYSDPDRGGEVRDRLLGPHPRQPGYRGLIALADDEVVGMAYGYRTKGGQWWHDVVAAALGPAAGRWLGDAYELVEVAVAPGHQGRGVGTALIEALLEGRREKYCVLSTRTDSRAHRLYRRLGFDVIQTMPFYPGGAPFYVMARPLRGGAAHPPSREAPCARLPLDAGG